MKIRLPNGVLLEPESEEELRWLLPKLGIIAPTPTLTLTAPTVTPAANGSHESTAKEPTSQWSRANVDQLLRELPHNSRRLVKLLVSRGDLPTSDIAKEFHYNDNRPIGGMLAAIRSRAEALGLPAPISSAEMNGERRLVLDPDIRKVTGAQ